MPPWRYAAISPVSEQSPGPSVANHFADQYDRLSAPVVKLFMDQMTPAAVLAAAYDPEATGRTAKSPSLISKGGGIFVDQRVEIKPPASSVWRPAIVCGLNEGLPPMPT
jgi:hypothetical protein